MRRVAWRLESLAYDGLSLLLRALGFERASALGAWLLARLGPHTSKQRIVLRNLDIAFPKLDATQKRSLACTAWANLGRTFAEFPLTHRLRAPGPRVAVEGMEHLDAVVASSRPCVVVTGHFANWEVMACVLAQSALDCAITYRRINNPLMDRRVRGQRQAYGTRTLVPKSGAAGARQLLQALKAGRSVALLGDQKFNTGLGLPFFDHTAMTAPGPVRLALQADVPILRMWCRRDGARFTVGFEPLWTPHDVESGVAEILRWTEEIIRRAPAQWFWPHRRWPKEEYR